MSAYLRWWMRVDARADGESWGGGFAVAGSTEKSDNAVQTASGVVREVHVLMSSYTVEAVQDVV